MSRVGDDVFRLPSGKLVAVSTVPRTYLGGVQYCRGRGMVIASIHSQADADSLEFLLPGPTYLGAKERHGTGQAKHLHMGKFEWEDGSDFDFLNERSEMANQYYCDEGNGRSGLGLCAGELFHHQMHDETHIAAIPGKLSVDTTIPNGPPSTTFTSGLTTGSATRSLPSCARCEMRGMAGRHPSALSASCALVWLVRATHQTARAVTLLRQLEWRRITSAS